MNDGKAFSSSWHDGMTCSYQCPDQFQLLPGHYQAKTHWISRYPQKPNLLQNNTNDTRNNMKSQIKKKKNGGSISLWNY